MSCLQWEGENRKNSILNTEFECAHFPVETDSQVCSVAFLAWNAFLVFPLFDYLTCKS